MRTPISIFSATKGCCICLALLCCLLASSLQAQPRLAQAEYMIGAYGGVTASTVFFNPRVGGMTDMLTVPLGGNGGLLFRYGGHKFCSMQVELGYSQRGWREVSTSEGYDYMRRLHYLQVPILTHIHFGGEKAQGFINLGPQFGFCFASQEQGTKQTASTYQYRPIDKPFDWGIVGGIGFYAGSKHVGWYQLEARVHYSFGSLYNNARAEHFAASNLFTLSINLAYLWQIQ